MAWCDHCEQLVDDAETRTDEEGVSRCPTCDNVVAPGDEAHPPRAPWHFKVLLIGTVGYLIYRLIWFIFWLRQHA
ncbi:MAG: hypothetical protein ACRDZR_18200 [Acidimicrobiales bacterium]